eukprot:gene4834-3465_t
MAETSSNQHPHGDVFAFVPHKNFACDSFAPNLAAFCDRIHYHGPLEPTMEVLRALHFHFVLTFPFENLSIHGLPHYQPPPGGEPVSVDPAVIEQKLLLQGRGGYCFEMNQYFSVVLRAIGFTVATKSARVLWQFEAGYARPRSHLVTLVSFGGDDVYLCDVSFGGNSPPMPLQLHSAAPQESVYDTYRVVDMPSPPYPAHHKLLQIRRNDPINKRPAETAAPEWLDMYFFDTHELSTVADWEQANFQVCVQANTLFTAHLLVGFTTLHGRVVLFDNKFLVKQFVDGGSAASTTRQVGGREFVVHDPLRRSEAASAVESTDQRFPFAVVNEQEVTSREAFVALLREQFHVTVPDEAVSALRLPGASW